MTPETKTAAINEVSQRADHVIRLGEEMSQLMESEIALFTRRQTPEYGQFVKRKQQLLLDYQNAVKSLMSERATFSELPVTQRAQLRAAGARLDTVARQSAEKLTIAAAATHKVLQVIIDAARQDAMALKVKSYGPMQNKGVVDDRSIAPPIMIAERA